MADEYPKMLYRDGSEIEWEGKSLNTLTVDDAEGEKAARTDGWVGVGEKPKKKAAE